MDVNLLLSQIEPGNFTKYLVTEYELSQSRWTFTAERKLTLNMKGSGKIRFTLLEIGVRYGGGWVIVQTEDPDQEYILTDYLVRINPAAGIKALFYPSDPQVSLADFMELDSRFDFKNILEGLDYPLWDTFQDFIYDNALDISYYLSIKNIDEFIEYSYEPSVSIMKKDKERLIQRIKTELGIEGALSEAEASIYRQIKRGEL